ncbi:T-lymphocyte surface antigen Ly-9 [Cyprinus carpio]|uniref:T-lymphocyte surface antigen Ly-9 n=1 Tax=Cyprinus carpio TaxID=7962 RepID=A0A8C1MD12_CYPCA|nr:T-lymphocyte surface antigen Ly-9 [Cyprinus carpio]
MIHTSVFLLCLLIGVFGADTDNTETVRVMLGDPVTLHTDLGTVRRDDHIVWVFGPDSPDNQIAELMKWSYMLSIYVSGKMPFRDALQLNHQTGSLTIKNTKSEHSGRYKLTIIHDRKTSHKRFDVIVYAALSVPIISADSSQNSTASERSAGPACVLVCSVTNASRATLSFFKGSDLVSSVSGSDSSSSLSLPLEVEYHDENSYSCVVNNSISNHSTLFNITDLCQPPPAASDDSLLFCLLLIPVALTVTALILCVCRKRRKAEEETDENC